jgi:hypothetical protein
MDVQPSELRGPSPPETSLLARADAGMTKGVEVGSALSDALDSALKANTAFVAQVAGCVVDALASLASHIPLAGPCAGVLKDIFALYQVRPVH